MRVASCVKTKKANSQQNDLNNREEKKQGHLWSLDLNAEKVFCTQNQKNQERRRLKTRAGPENYETRVVQKKK